MIFRPETAGERRRRRRWRFPHDPRHDHRVAGGRLAGGSRLRRGHVSAVPQGRRRRRRRPGARARPERRRPDGGGRGHGVRGQQSDDGRGRAVPVDDGWRRAAEQRDAERRRWRQQRGQVGGRRGLQQGIPRRHAMQKQQRGPRRSGIAGRRVVRRWCRCPGRVRCTGQHRRGAGARVPAGVPRSRRHRGQQRRVRRQIAAAEDLAAVRGRTAWWSGAGRPPVVPIVPLQEPGHHTGAAHVTGRHRLQRLRRQRSVPRPLNSKIRNN